MKEDELKNAYNAIKPDLGAFGNFVDQTLLTILDSKGYNTNLVQILPKHRIKGDDSLIGKVFYRINDYPADIIGILHRIEDKIGTRIVVKSLVEVKQIVDILNDTNGQFWEVSESRSINSNYNSPKLFDYHSVHYHIWPNDKTPILNHLGTYEKEIIKCELQIRTLLQHAWAEIAHDTVYKGIYGDDSIIVRTLSRSMALMEATDDYFERIYKRMQKEISIENIFIDSLKRLLTDAFNLPVADADLYLNREILKEFPIQNEAEINKVSDFITNNRVNLSKQLPAIKTYLKTQPIVLYLAYLIARQTKQIKDKWVLEEHILIDLFHSLGFSYRK